MSATKSNIVTPQMRVDQFPDEFVVRRNQLWCTWCKKLINHKRKDGINEHLWSKSHQDNRVARGAKMSYDPETPEAIERRKRKGRKGLIAKKISSIKELIETPRTSQSEISSSDEKEIATDLRQLFQDSDSDSTTSFEGFDESPHMSTEKRRSSSYTESTEDEESRRSIRPRKRPARLSDSLDNAVLAKIGKVATTKVCGRRKSQNPNSELSSPSESDLSPPARIRSMPIKKQISYSARQSDSLTSPPRGSLKMKFSRARPRSSSGDYHTKTGKKFEVVSGSGPKDGLKLKFVWKKQKKQTQTIEESNDTNKREPNDIPTGYEEMLRNITQADSDPPLSMQEEVVEEEIVDMKEDDLIIEDDWIPLPIKPPPDIENITDMKYNERPINTGKKELVIGKTKRMKNMVNLVSKGRFKSKKSKTMEEKKRKTTGYMLWAKQMREKVSRQYPGLEFGDVSKKLGDLWKKIPDKEKQMWKFRNQKLEKQFNTGTIRKAGSRMIETGPKKKAPPSSQNSTSLSYSPIKNPEAAMKTELERLPPPAMEAIDSAAYFSLLGEYFSKLSMTTKKVESRAVIQGADSILLDGLLCGLTSLMILTRQVPHLENAIDNKTLSKTLSNIAHIMPGI